MDDLAAVLSYVQDSLHGTIKRFPVKRLQRATIVTVDVICFPLFFSILQPGFSSPVRSFVKTAVMMIGEFDFDDTFNSDVTLPGVTWFLFIVFPTRDFMLFLRFCRFQFLDSNNPGIRGNYLWRQKRSF